MVLRSPFGNSSLIQSKSFRRQLGPAIDVESSGTVARRASLIDRLRLQAGYVWRNSANPMLIWFRATAESRDGSNFPAVVSSMAGMSIAYAGLPEGLAYTLDFTELQREPGAGSPPQRSSRTLPGAQLANSAQWPDSDLLIVGTSARKARQLPTHRSLVFPLRLHFVVNIDGDAELLNGRISKRQRWQFSRDQRQYNWTWRLERAPELFDHFYDRMYRPTMRKAHRDRERLEEREPAYECLFRTGRLFLLYEGDERVGGALCHWNKRSKVMTLRLLGVLDADDRHYRSGAYRAIYHLLINWSAENGVRQLDFGGTEPFLSKGTFQWKRRFGSCIVLPPNHFGGKRLWMQVLRDTPAVRDFLVANPVLAEGAAGALEAAYFHDQDRPARTDLSAKSPDRYPMRLIDLDTFLAATPKA